MWALKGLSIDDARVQAVEAAYREKTRTGDARRTLPGLGGENGSSDHCQRSHEPGESGCRSQGISTGLSPIPPPCTASIPIPPIVTGQCARKVVERAIRECRALGIRRVLLNASDAGRRIYEKAGFCALPDAMRFCSSTMMMVDFAVSVTYKDQIRLGIRQNPNLV